MYMCEIIVYVFLCVLLFSLNKNHPYVLCWDRELSFVDLHCFIFHLINVAWCIYLSSLLLRDILLVVWWRKFNFPKMVAAISPDPHSLLPVLPLVLSSDLILVARNLGELVAACTKRARGGGGWGCGSCKALPLLFRTTQLVPYFLEPSGFHLSALSWEFWWFCNHQAVRKSSCVGNLVWVPWFPVLILETS